MSRYLGTLSMKFKTTDCDFSANVNLLLENYFLVGVLLVFHAQLWFLVSYINTTFVASILRRNLVDDVKSQMEGVTRVYAELDSKISDKGGVQNLFGMNRKIRQALESISIGELDSMLAEIHRAKEGLTRLQEDVVEIRVLKEVLSSPVARINGQARSAAT
jgi:hypothetical protein